MKQHAIGGIALVALGLVAAFAQDDPDVARQADTGEPAPQELQHPLSVSGPFHCSQEGERHRVAEALVMLSCDDGGPDDCWRFDLLLFRDGCYSMRGTGLGGSSAKDAAVSSRFVERILLDAETYGLDAFDGDLRERREFGCPEWLTVHDGERQKTFVFHRLRQRRDYAKAMERGAEYARQLTVVDLIAKRLELLLIQ